MTGSKDIIEQQAAAWLALTEQADFTDWEGFLDWLEADPAHADAYDCAALEDLAGREPPRRLAASYLPAARPRRTGWSPPGDNRPWPKQRG